MGSISKKKLVQLMVEHKVEYIDLPLTTTNRCDLCDLKEEEDNVQDRGDAVRIGFLEEEQLGMAGVNKPRVATLQELKVAFVTDRKK